MSFANKICPVSRNKYFTSIYYLSSWWQPIRSVIDIVVPQKKSSSRARSCIRTNNTIYAIPYRRQQIQARPLRVLGPSGSSTKTFCKCLLPQQQQKKYVYNFVTNGGGGSCSRRGTWRFRKDKKASFLAPS